MAKLLILGNWHAGSSCASFAAAAEREGHTVVRVGPPFTVTDARRWREAIERMRWASTAEACQYSADVHAQSPVVDVVTEKGARLDWRDEWDDADAQITFWAYGEHPTLHDQPLRPSRRRKPTALVAGDTHTGHRPSQEWDAAGADHLFLQFKPADLDRFDHPSKHWLPPAADPEVWRPLPDERKQYDVLLCASTDPDVHAERVQLVQHLIDAGISVMVAHAFGARANALYAQARVVLNRSLAGDVNLRVAEAVLAGAVLVTDRVEGLDRFGINRAYAYADPGAAVSLIRDALAHEKEYGLRAAMLRRWALQQHTWQCRVRSVLQTMGVSDDGGRNEAGGESRGAGAGRGHARPHGADRTASAAGGGVGAEAAPARVTVVIPAYGHQDMTYRLAAAVAELADVEVLVVDDASPDEFPEPPAGVRLLTTAHNKGFAGACNDGAQAATADVLVFLNNDTQPEDGWLPPLANEAQLGGIAGALILNPDGSVQAAGLVRDGRGEWRNDPVVVGVTHPYDVPAVMGACLAVERDVFWRLGGFDQGFPSGGEDVDLCLRARAAGLPVRLVPQSRVRHAEGTTRFHIEGVREKVQASITRLQERWGDGDAGVLAAGGDDARAAGAGDVGGGGAGGAGADEGRGGAVRPGAPAGLLTFYLDGPTDVVKGGSLAVVNGGLLRALEAREGLRGTVLHRNSADVWLSHFWTGLDACWPAPPPDVKHWIVLADWEGHAGPPPESWKFAMSDPRFRCLVVPSAYSRRLLVAAGWPEDTVRVIAYGYDPEVFSPGEPERRDGRFTALFVGGLLHRKGVDVLYEAWRLAFTPDEPVRLVLKTQGGQTFYRGQEVLPPAELPNAHFHDGDDWRPEAMANLYRSADAVVQPYRAEGFCLPLLEALACGVPVVYPGHGPAPEFVPPKAGIKLPDAEPATLARALRYLYEHPEVRRMMGSKAAAGTTLTWPRVAHLWAGLIEEVCGE